MAVFAVLSVFTGIQIHYAGDFQTHDIWHSWAIVHILVNIIFLIVATTHIRQHWGFYKSLFRKGPNRTIKNKVTMVVLIVFLALSLTGISLFMFVKGQGSVFGFVHYIIGLIFGIVGLLHFLKMWKIFKKGIAK